MTLWKDTKPVTMLSILWDPADVVKIKRKRNTVRNVNYTLLFSLLISTFLSCYKAYYTSFGYHLILLSFITIIGYKNHLF